MATIYKQGGADRLMPEIVTATPLHEINSTAYAVKLEYRFEDSLHGSVVVAFREDGDPIPTNVEQVKAHIKTAFTDIEPHFSMEWTNRKVQTPAKGRPLSTEVSIAEKIV